MIVSKQILYLTQKRFFRKGNKKSFPDKPLKFMEIIWELITEKVLPDEARAEAEELQKSQSGMSKGKHVHIN